MKNNFFLLASLLIWGISMAQIGVGNNNPKVNLDARTSGNSAIAFGDTNQTATVAGEGAMKYDNTTKQVYYSDGTSWMHMAGAPNNSFIPRLLVSGRVTTEFTTFGISVGDPPYYKWNFGYVFPNDNNWNTVTNTYTVANAGFYQMTLAGPIESANSSNSSTWVVMINGNNKYVLSILSNIKPSYLAYSGGSITLYLAAGTTISFGSSHCFGCNNPDPYTIKIGNTFTISQVGS